MNPYREPHATIPSEADQLVWLGRLIGASTTQAVAELVVELLRACPVCRDARLLWLERGECRATGDSPNEQDKARLLAVLRDGDAGRLADGELLMRLAPDVPAVLLTVVQGDAATGPGVWAALERCLALAGQQLRQMLALAELHDSHHQLERSENLLRALFSIADLAGADLDMPELLRGIHGIVGTLMYAENFFIVRHDPESGTTRFLYYADTEDAEGPDIVREDSLEAMRGSLTWHLLTLGRPLMGSTEQLAAQIGVPLNVIGPDSVDWLGVPMLREGRVHGALVVQSYRQGIGYSDEDRAVLGFVAEHVLTALERKRSKDELEDRVLQRTRELAAANLELQEEVLERQRAGRLQSVLFRLAELGSADLDEDAFYRRVHAEVGSLLDASNFYIALLDEEQQQLHFPYYMDAGVQSAFSLSLGQRSITVYVLRTGKPWLGSRHELDALAQEGKIVRRVIGVPPACWLGVPLRAGDTVIGVVAVQGYDDEIRFGAADQELLSFAALQIANSIQRRRAAAALLQANLQLEHRVEARTRELREQIAEREQMQRQLRHEVMHDPLTGLPNRGFLRERLGERLARRSSDKPCALLYLDVDRFKVINDSLGHLAGDAFLQAVANRLRACVSAPDVAARLSGDEFAILLDAVVEPAVAERMAHGVLQALRQPLSIGGRELEPSASVGIAIAGQHERADALLRDADIALYRAKQLGRGRYALFDETMERDAVDELALEVELRHALQHGEFVPYFQPIFRLDNGEVVGHEALLRWNHPRRGVLLPGDFVRVARDCGQLEAIDWQLYGKACERMAQPDAGSGFVTINVSPLHLRHAGFDRQLLQLLEGSGLPPERLLIELTEDALLEDPVLVRDTLERLRAAGVQAALDDFGTGYSSLGYLHSLPLGKLKIDQMFVRELDTAGGAGANTVVAAILALAARALGIDVIAEGIETEAQRDALQAMGCEFGQGFLFSRPQPQPHGV